jgi:hypothetical protein
MKGFSPDKIANKENGHELDNIYSLMIRDTEEFFSTLFQEFFGDPLSVPPKEYLEASPWGVGAMGTDIAHST